jgi:hypothetical protein
MNLTRAIRLRFEAIVVLIIAGIGDPSSPSGEAYIATKEK